MRSHAPGTMAGVDASARCPCGSGDTYGACCRPFHCGDAVAPTAQALMRSRFSAFAVGNAAYLRATWHESTRPAVLDLAGGPAWTRLDIVEVHDGGPFDTTGVVEFRAHHRTGRAARGVLHERSRFVREDGRWFYLDGDLLA